MCDLGWSRDGNENHCLFKRPGLPIGRRENTATLEDLGQIVFKEYFHLSR